MDNPEKKVTEPDIITDLQTNEKYKSFFSGFHPLSIENFIRGFASIKMLYTTYADMYHREKERSLLGMLPEAYSCLEEIQQKKLFDAQCLWRAGKLDTEGITNTCYFNYWERYILTCPFIEPVTENDLDLYTGYIKSTNTDMKYWMTNYQDYDLFKEALNMDEGGTYPDWYEYYDTYRGTGMNIKLPDIKGEEQEFYRKLYIDDHRAKQVKEGTAAADVPVSQIPFLSSYNTNHIYEFLKEFESPKDLELWENYNASQQNSDEDELQDAIFLLSEAREPVAVESNRDYREAIIKSAAAYRRTLIIRALPLAFEEYEMKLNAGISFYDTVTAIEDDDLIKIIDDQVMKGKILNGELPDTDH